MVTLRGCKAQVGRFSADRRMQHNGVCATLSYVHHMLHANCDLSWLFFHVESGFQQVMARRTIYLRDPVVMLNCRRSHLAHAPATH
jgi:hypothetical protein